MIPDVYQMDALKELINIGIGRSASMLNDMTKSHINLQVPEIKMVSIDELKNEINKNEIQKYSIVKLGFKGMFSGNASLIFTPQSAAKLVSALTNDESDPFILDEFRAQTLCEVGNIVINGIMGSIGNLLKHHIDYFIPGYFEGTIKDILSSSNFEKISNIILTRTRFSVQKLDIEGDILIVFELGSFDNLLAEINNLKKDGFQEYGRL